MKNEKFRPEAHLSFTEGAAKITNALKELKVEIKSKILTSRDQEAISLVNLLRVNEVPDGFKKWQLPLVFNQSQLFISIGHPDIVVPEHSHDEGDGIRFIISGSIYFKGQELTAGDWMYIPAGKKYSIKTGPLGVAMCYCYECCCAGSLKLNYEDWVINPENG
ncbi:MAG: hypothetical protein JWR50_8 [Mucilaginibacter sp.]|nr:hypothetical protein [Mucilaginibacter sp.]